MTIVSGDYSQRSEVWHKCHTIFLFAFGRFFRRRFAWGACAVGGRRSAVGAGATLWVTLGSLGSGFQVSPILLLLRTILNNKTAFQFLTLHYLNYPKPQVRRSFPPFSFGSSPTHKTTQIGTQNCPKTAPTLAPPNIHFFPRLLRVNFWIIFGYFEGRP